MRHRKAIFNGCRIKRVKKRASESQEKSRDDIMVYNMVAVEPLKMYIQGSTFSLVTKPIQPSKDSAVYSFEWKRKVHCE